MFGALERVDWYLRAASDLEKQKLQFRRESNQLNSFLAGTNRSEYETSNAPSKQLSVSKIYALHLCGQMLGCGIKQTKRSRYSAPPAPQHT